MGRENSLNKQCAVVAKLYLCSAVGHALPSTWSISNTDKDSLQLGLPPAPKEWPMKCSLNPAFSCMSRINVPVLLWRSHSAEWSMPAWVKPPWNSAADPAGAGVSPWPCADGLNKVMAQSCPHLWPLLLTSSLNSAFLTLRPSKICSQTLDRCAAWFRLNQTQWVGLSDMKVQAVQSGSHRSRLWQHPQAIWFLWPQVAPACCEGARQCSKLDASDLHWCEILWHHPASIHSSSQP